MTSTIEATAVGLTGLHQTSTCVVSVTPFDAHEALDETALRAHLRRMAAAGIDVYVCGSGTGEANALTPDERQRVLTIAGQELKERVPVVGMGIAPRTAKQMVEFVAETERAGLDAVHIYAVDPGHGVRATDRELEGYFSYVLERTHIPALLSTHVVNGLVPIRVIDTLARRFPNLDAVVCTTPDVSYLLQLIAAMRGRLRIFTGDVTQALTALAAGADGYFCSEANVMPYVAGRVTQAWNAGAYQGSVEAFGALLRLISLNPGYGTVRAIKAILQILHLPGGIPRTPRLPLTEAEEQGLARSVAELGIADAERIVAAHLQRSSSGV